MELDPARLASAPLGPFAGEGWRHLSPRYEPLSGEGARLNGGRFNPPGSSPVLYLCRTRACVVAELRHLGDQQAIGLEGLLPRVVYRYEIELTRVLDLTIDAVRKATGLGSEILTGPDWTACQELGAIAHTLGTQAILSPSATGVDHVLAIFVQHIGLGTLTPTLVEEWHQPSDL